MHEAGGCSTLETVCPTMAGVRILIECKMHEYRYDLYYIYFFIYLLKCFDKDTPCHIYVHVRNSFTRCSTLVGNIFETILVASRFLSFLKSPK